MFQGWNKPRKKIWYQRGSPPRMTVKGVQIQIASGMSYTVQEKPARNTCEEKYGIKVFEPILETLYGMEEKIVEE